MKNSKVYFISLGFLFLLVYLFFNTQATSVEKTQLNEHPVTQYVERHKTNLENRKKDTYINHKESQQVATKESLCSENTKKSVIVLQATKKLPNNATQLTIKQRANLKNEQSIQKEGWLVYPLNDIEDAPTLKYVPYMDNTGRFHSVQVYDLSLEPQFQLIYAYSIPYTDEFPHVSKTDAQEILENNFISNTYASEYMHKLVWLEDKFKPFHLFKCVNEFNKKSDFCLVNAHTGEITLRSEKTDE